MIGDSEARLPFGPIRLRTQSEGAGFHSMSLQVFSVRYPGLIVPARTRPVFTIAGAFLCLN